MAKSQHVVDGVYFITFVFVLAFLWLSFASHIRLETPSFNYQIDIIRKTEVIKWLPGEI